MFATLFTASRTAELVKVLVTSSFTFEHILSSFVRTTICGKPEVRYRNKVENNINCFNYHNTIFTFVMFFPYQLYHMSHAFDLP